MEKKDIIRELHRIQDLWNRIIPLTEKSMMAALSKGDAEERRKSEAASKYHYNPQIKIPNELPTSHASEVESDIAHRHKKDCLNAAQKKMRMVRIVLIIATIISLAITLLPNIQIVMDGDFDKFNFFSAALGGSDSREEDADQDDEVVNMGDLVTDIIFAGYGDGLDINIILGVFAIGVQMLAVLLAGMAASSIVKAKACERVPELGHSLKGLWIAASVIVGIFGFFTWVTVAPIGAVSLLPAIVLTPILKSKVAKLESANHPYPTLDESARLEKAKALDAKNHEANEMARKEANAKKRKEFEANQKKHIAECEKEIAHYDEQIELLTDDIAASMKQVKSEILSDKDNNLDTVNRLLDYLENGRADTLKEALYMVDMDKEREKDRETQKQIAQMKLENDRYMAELERQETRRYNDQLLAQQRAHNERMQRELDRHNAQVEREQAEHHREMQRELDRLKDKLDS